MNIPLIKGDKTTPDPTEWQSYDDETLIGMIDPLIVEWDINRDGFIDYTEFMERNS